MPWINKTALANEWPASSKIVIFDYLFSLKSGVSEAKERLGELEVREDVIIEDISVKAC